MHYDKPHLTIDQQLRRLIDRGLHVDDRAAAGRVLETVGYYRFSAYAYPFRTTRETDAPRGTSVQFRADTFQVGASFGWAEEIWGFDRALRLLLLDAVEMVEIALRSKVGYHLGRRDTFGYLSRESLDPAKCDRQDADDYERSVFDVWIDRYKGHQTRATAEDFIRHYVEKYDARLPVWVATEIMEFGQLVRLFGFMRDEDQSSVSKDLAQVSGAVLARWMKVVNYARNLSAHHARIWNRKLTYKLGRLPENAPKLLHLNAHSHGRERVYAVCAVLAFLTDAIRPDSRWSNRLRELIEGFPATPPVSPETHMGFPQEWRAFELWSR